MEGITDTTGHNKTPAVRLNPKSLTPKKLKLNGDKPRVSSKENIFTPINSATSALAIKKPPKMINRLTDLSLNIYYYAMFGFRL